jgi:hypothetical protein
LVSSGIRLVALEPKSTYRPSGVMAGSVELEFASVPSAAWETRTVETAGAACPAAAGASASTVPAPIATARRAGSMNCMDQSSP